MPPIFSFGYWFDVTPEPLARLGLNFLLVAFGAVLAAGVIARVLAAKKSGNMYWAKGGVKAARMCFWMAPIGFLLTWFAYEQVQFFGARFWLLAWALAFLIWLGFIIKYVMVVVPEQAADFAERARIEKYLPKKK